ncbi:MAG: response regulator, partial [Gammaproteobacteria bacterium]|nr:response regulator [Gammaproteobacteria bacterium]
MDGYDVKKCLQANSDTQNIPVVGISANAMPKDIARSKAAGFKDYLTKPIDMVKFIAVIDEILKK